MSAAYQPIDPTRTRTHSVRQRAHKASIDRLASLPEPGASAADLLASLPDYLGAAEFRQVADAIVQAVQHDRPVVVAFGAHVIKVGCAPILVDLMQRGVIAALAGNGACAIHDVEMALWGETSEEVADTIRDGSFGMVSETMTFFDEAVARARSEQLGLGRAVGRLLLEREAPHRAHSLFAQAAALDLPATVHVALGTDTVHMSPRADGAAWGEATLRDFHLICAVIADLGAAPGTAKAVGGVWLNLGSAVVLPEVFLKAIAVARNQGANLDALTTANLDMLRHYRPQANVVSRPVAPGRGHSVTGQHEILLPLLRQAVIEQLAAAR